jgi:hypothetical protein
VKNLKSLPILCIFKSKTVNENKYQTTNHVAGYRVIGKHIYFRQTHRF